MTSAIASAATSSARPMRVAGFRYVFLGIENCWIEDLAFLRARPRTPNARAAGPSGSATMRAVDVLHRHGLFVVGGLIVGNPGDTRESIEANLDFARKHVDWPYIQHPTPYPGTPMTSDFRAKGLIVTEHVEEYDGTTAVVRTEHLEAEEIEFLRWQAERWMKCITCPRLRHDPGFVLRQRTADAAAHVPRHHLADVARPGKRARRVPPLQGDQARRTGVFQGDGGFFTETSRPGTEVETLHRDLRPLS